MSELKKYTKVFIIIFVILIIYTVVVGAIARKRINDDADKNKPIDNPTTNTEPAPTTYDLNVILLPNTILGYSGGVWEENPSYEYDYIFLKVYAEELYDDVRLINTDRWHIMRRDGSFIDYSSDFIAVTGTIPYEVFNNISSELTSANKDIISAFLDSKGIVYNFDALTKKVYAFDINHDGIRDEIYVVSNVFIDNYAGFDKTFAYVFVRTLNQNVVLYENVNNNINAMNTCNPDLQGVIVVDDSPYAIVECTYASETGAKHMLYTVANKSAIKQIETKTN